MKNALPSLTRRAVLRGFTLVEMMVGVTVGLITVLVITQALGTFENQKSITSSGANAQDNGLAAMTQIEQDVRNAGVGFNNSAAYECSTMYSYYEATSSSGATSPAPMFSNIMSMAPVVITDGGATGSDTIRIHSGSDFLGSIPAVITSTMPQPSAELNVSFTKGFDIGEMILVSQGGKCTVMQVTQVQNAALNIQHNPGSFPSWNPQASFYNTAPGNTWPAYTTGAKIMNVGQMTERVYSIDSNYNLQVVSTSTSNPSVSTTSVLVKDIVSLQAEYGVSSGVGVQEVSSWVAATNANGWDVLDSNEIKRIKAIRLTIVARSSKKEGSIVTTAAPGGVDISSVPDWQKYRYRVYTTIIPLRNIIWANV